jgi:polyhydroxyalkanoate synthesis regulator phasin
MMSKSLPLAVFAALSLGATPVVHAADAQSVEELRNTVINMLEGLVQKGVLTREQAQAMVADAQTKAAEQAKAKASQDAAEKDAVRVTYVPESVREQIRDEMRPEVTADVTKEVIATAKKEGWGVPGALPEWAKNVRLYGDVRARYQADWYADTNRPQRYLDINKVNDRGSSVGDPDVFLNVTEDRKRFVGRLRAGLTAQLGNAFSLDFRLASGNALSPVSTNQTLGANYAGRWAIAVDKAAILWNPINVPRTQEWDLRFGRFANPFVSLNELIWDNDLTFEGVSATYAYDLFGRDDNKMERGIFVTAGAFPLQEVELSTDDKWLYGAQLGTQFGVGAQSRLSMTGGYFEYDNITGVRNPEIGSELNNFTAPGFVQKGNTLFDINPDVSELYALGGKYRLATANVRLDMEFGKTHVMIGGEYVKNLGWDTNDVLLRTGGAVLPERLVLTPLGQPGYIEEVLAERTEGYEFGVVVGRPSLAELGHWRASMFYRYVERDAVLDAFTDSDLHLGGTDSEGYQFAFDLGLSRATWLRLRYLTANEIDGAPLGIDVMQLDLNGQF